MYGSIRKDLNIVDRGFENNLTLPNFRHSQYVHSPQVTTDKLNALYNVLNMPIFFVRAGQAGAFQMKQAGVKNNNIAQILYPKRMPYKVTP